MTDQTASRQTMNSSAPPARTAEARPVRILLVDDQRFVAVMLRAALKSQNDLELDWCERATDALEHANRLTPDLIFQDLVMPDIDGLTLLRGYRSSAAAAQARIIVLSANDDAATRRQAAEAGADDYLIKLPKASELIACIRRHVPGVSSAHGILTAAAR